jgi:hypothetical protein
VKEQQFPSPRIVNSLPSSILLPSEGLLVARERFKKFVLPPALFVVHRKTGVDLCCMKGNFASAENLQMFKLFSGNRQVWM